ncbi:hypothetical protein [Cupriavidus plantarum]|uniref:Uncharacterized protein n=1 Tax=Cupriavidus plantarum TaxID=942865 RepID=A0A316EXY0_9BURK|nr:hypothetical protein [Cupriavidus plantarum]NYH99084.1 hypothetical protein [Cupriavidus plantarum]PWK36308.1 hypothetical protein C7419_101162 [Cupriavidus plantarum]REF02939.1 hypothetical protein C7418_1762 [Cupriavidus plantarum]RLK44196.1 hypothetical protein C7417_0173 [Cupriavidus plantarum]CAG2141960.1 hypothetical protein LMG26296_03101 [Cupriavidus plantarum]
MVRQFMQEYATLRQDAAQAPRAQEAARLRLKLHRKEIGMAVVALGAMAMFLDAARAFAALAT